MNFSEKLIRLRKREGISQEELASYLEVSRQAVSRWEQGTALPDAGNLLKLRQRFGVSLDWLLEDAQGWENLTDGAPTGSEGGGTAPSPKLRKSVLPWAIPLGVSGFGLLLLGIFSSIFPAEYMVASTVIAGNQEPADRIYRGLAGFLKCNNLEWLFRLCLVIAIGSLLAGLWQKGVMNIHLNQGIRSKSGLNLKEAVVRQIILDEQKPGVRFIGKGVIIPQSTQLSVPFQAIYLRGVTVSVIKILEQNIGQFLQSNNLDESGELMRVGRLIARKTIFLDEEGLDLSRWNTFAVDLKRLIEPEPGAIYRLELSFDRPLSTYPCGNDTVKISKEQILASDEIRFKEESARFDGGAYYYRQYDWSSYNWKEWNDPCSDSYYFNKVEGCLLYTSPSPRDCS
mgnify:CR=1 FL=1